MSSHSLKAKRRHPDPKTYKREAFQFGHITIEVSTHPEYGKTFALIAGDALQAKDRRPLFTGHITKGMGDELRKIAAKIDAVEEL